MDPSLQATIIAASITLIGLIVAQLAPAGKNRSDAASALILNYRDELKRLTADLVAARVEADAMRDERDASLQERHKLELETYRLTGELTRARTVAESSEVLLVEKDARIDSLTNQVQSLSGIVTQKSAGLERLVAQLEMVRSCPLALPGNERVCPIADTLSALGTHPEITLEDS